MVRLLIAIVLASARLAVAGEHEAVFAKTFGVAESAVHDVAGYELPAGNDTTHVVIGRAERMTGAVLLTCDATQCAGRRVELGTADAVELNGIVDLHGTPGPLPSRAIAPGKLAGAQRMKFPALVIRVRETTKKRRVKLYVISLVEADRASTVLQDTAEELGPDGRGFVRSYKLEPAKGGKDTAKDGAAPLDIVATERRKPTCDPTEQRFTLEEHHYRTKSYTPGKNC